MPCAVDLGADRRGLWTALIALQQTVEHVDGGGAHDVPVLINTRRIWHIIDDIQTHVTDIFGNPESLRGGGFNEVVAPADDDLRPIGSDPMPDFSNLIIET